MQVSPLGRGRRVVVRLRGLRQSGRNAHGHLGAGTVQDGLIDGKADRLAKEINYRAGQRHVAVLQQGIADLDVRADLVAVDFGVSEPEGHLVQRTACLSPHGFGRSSHDDLAGLAADRAHVDVLHQLAVFSDLLTEQFDDHGRDGQLSAADRAVLAFHLAQTG